MFINLGVLGFGSTGIVGGSLAAGIQSWIGNVAGGSWFATLQSLGIYFISSAEVMNLNIFLQV